MSLVHMLLQKTEETEQEVIYEAVSVDFNERRQWAPIARLKISKMTGEYEYEPLGAWLSMSVVDPKRYADESPANMEKLQSGTYGFCGAWSGRLHLWVSQLVERHQFPPTFPS